MYYYQKYSYLQSVFKDLHAEPIAAVSSYVCHAEGATLDLVPGMVGEAPEGHRRPVGVGHEAAAEVPMLDVQGARGRDKRRENNCKECGHALGLICSGMTDKKMTETKKANL